MHVTRYADALAAALLATAHAAPALAADTETSAVVGECTLGAAAIAEPWSTQTRTFAQGAIRVAHLDTDGEPVCCPSHLMILSPAGAPPEDYRVCHMVSAQTVAPMGFLHIDVAGIASSYDPERGLLLTVPTRTYLDANTGAYSEGTFAVRINQATGAVTLE